MRERNAPHGYLLCLRDSIGYDGFAGWKEA
jgi:hypothetical protein